MLSRGYWLERRRQDGSLGRWMVAPAAVLVAVLVFVVAGTALGRPSGHPKRARGVVPVQPLARRASLAKARVRGHDWLAYIH